MIDRLDRLFSYLTVKTFFTLLLLCVPGAALAQGTAAVATGFVTDASGAKLPGATVTYTNTATGVVSTTTTNGEGLYRVGGLLPGVYRSTVTMEGFKTAIKDGIDLHLEDVMSLNYALDVGSTSESVTVNANANILETSSPTVSQVIEGRQVEDTPLNGRNSMNLVALTPGVVPQGGTSGAATSNVNGGALTVAFGFSNYQIAGGLANTGSIYLDGAPLNLIVGHALSLVIQQDAVQEFRVESSVVNPQYGEFGGGIISFATKSGQNKLHGSIYEYLRNTALNANNFFNNETGVARPQFIQNQFGATVGGPIKRDKAFFFASYEGFRLAQGVPNAGRVPTPAELSGDFTADPTIYDPTTGKQFSCNGVANVICPNRFDPTSNYLANVLKYFPTPNTTAAGAAINFTQNGKAFAVNENYDLRGDFNLGSKQKLFARYVRLDRGQQPTRFLTNTTEGPTSTPSVGATGQQYALGDTIVLSPTSVLDLRASYLRYFAYVLPAATNVNLAGLGPFWGAIANKINFDGFPSLTLTNNITYPYALMNVYNRIPNNNYVLSGTYSKVAGRHSLTFGGEARRREEYYNQTVAAPGLFVFAGTVTSCIPSAIKACPNGVVIPGSGATPVSDFLLGTFTAAPLGFPEVAFPSTVNLYGGLFANDTFQVSQRLTITAGLRYELPGGFTEKHDRNTVLLPQLANPLVLVNTPAHRSRSDLQTHLTLFSPRVGVAFQPYPGTSVRAGYSVAFLPQDTIATAGPDGSPVNSPTTFIPPRGQLSAPLGGTATAPQTTIVQPIGRAYNGTQFLGQTIQGRIPNSRFPYTQQWNASVQQALSASSVLQFAYLGARGNHMPVFTSININQLPDQYDGLTTAQITQMSGNIYGSALRPYPNYQNVNALSPYVGDTYYNSLQVTFNKRFSGGGTLLGNYSWAKFLGNSESAYPTIESHAQGVIQNYNNLRGEKSYLSFDVPHRLIVSYILDLPVGKGKRFLGNTSDFVNNMVGGWNVSGINTFQSGFPNAVIATANSLATLYGAGTIRPNVVPGCNKSLRGSIVSQVRHSQPVLNAACFTSPADTSFGNQPRTDGSIRTQGVDNWDFSLGKTTQIHEDINLVFRAEAFNVINRVQFGDPNLTSSSSLFGVITTQANAPRAFQFSLRLNY